MKFSIVTVCFNASATIESCLRSVAEQTHPDIEHIIIDGQSTDDTLEIARRYPHVSQIVSEADTGLYDAMNKGIIRATGDYVLFLNADDTFHAATTIADAAAEIAGNSGADVYYGALEVRPLSGKAYVFRPPAPDQAAEFMVLGCLPHQSTLARPSVFKRTGLFDLQYRYHAEYDWFLKILHDPSIDVRALATTIGSFQEGGASSDLAKGQPEVYVIQSKAPLFAGDKWDAFRLSAYQNAFLHERVEVSRLREAIRTATLPQIILGERTRPLAAQSWQRLFRRILPAPLLNTLKKVRPSARQNVG